MTFDYYKCAKCGFEWITNKSFKYWNKVLETRGCPNCKTTKRKDGGGFMVEHVDNESENHPLWKMKARTLRKL